MPASMKSRWNFFSGESSESIMRVLPFSSATGGLYGHPSLLQKTELFCSASFIRAPGFEFPEASGFSARASGSCWARAAHAQAIAKVAAASIAVFIPFLRCENPSRRLAGVRIFFKSPIILPYD